MLITWDVENPPPKRNGPAGPPGNPGTAATVSVGTTTTGAPGSSASVVNSGTSSAAVFDFTVPQGSKGDKGDTGDSGANGADGAAATVSVGTTTTGLPGSNASVTNAGTSSAAVLNFTIPRGDKGDQGDQGPAGPAVVSAAAARSPAYATAYQTANPSKPSFISAVIETIHSVAVVGTIQDTVELRIGANAAQVAAGTGGNVVAQTNQRVTAVLTLVGLVIGQRDTLQAWVPAGWYWALRRTTGTAATIVSATEQELG